MAYVLQYIFEFHNDLGEFIQAFAYKNDQRGNGLKGEYFNNINLTGSPVFTRNDPTVDYQWFDSAPAPTVNPDNFSVRWTGQFRIDMAGTYTFYTRTDDGVRLYIDGNLVIDDWNDHPITENTIDLAMTAGLHSVVMEIYERAGDAAARLYWSLPDFIEKEIIPQQNLFAPLLADPIHYEIVPPFQINVSSENNTPLDSMFSHEMVMDVLVPLGDLYIDWKTFITSTQDDWKIVVQNDGQFVFHGFVVPDESPSDFQDKPYVITLRATDGLKLLKTIPLTKYDLTEFFGKNRFIDYVAQSLEKTNLGLELTVYCNIYNNAMFVRDSDPKYDMFAQCQFDYRTFMTSATEFVNCYDAILLMFKHHFRVFYYNARWYIFRIPEYQVLYSDRFFSLYGVFGDIQSGGIDPEDYVLVGKNQLIHPVNVNQKVASTFANKSVKHIYNYEVWDEIPRNNKFERGTLQTGISTTTEKYYSISDWNFGLTNFGNYPLQPAIIGTTGTAYRKSTLDAYGIEITRELVITPQVTANTLYDVLESERVPVNVGDIVDIAFDFHVETAAGMTGTSVARVYIIPDDGTAVIQMNNAAGTLFDNIPWISSVNGLTLQFNGGDPTIYTSFSARSKPIPKNGVMVIALYGHNRATFGKWFFKDFNITYTPYVAGGYQQVKGDSWMRTQRSEYPDNISEEIQLSDSKGVFKGAFWSGPDAGTLRVLTPQWYRWGLTESRQYKEILNLGVFNLTYRRMQKIEGDFRGTKYAPHNNPIDIKPIGFHRVYRFEDEVGETRDYMLIAPYRMDMTSGIFNAVFIEVKRSDADGSHLDTGTFNYIF